MKPYGFQQEARTEFLEAARHYEAQQPGLGRRFFDAVKVGVDRVRERPLLYHEIDPGFRQCLVEHFPYGIVYRLKPDRIEVLAVAHLHREPGYWKERTGTS